MHTIYCCRGRLSVDWLVYTFAGGRKYIRLHGRCWLYSFSSKRWAVTVMEEPFLPIMMSWLLDPAIANHGMVVRYYHDFVGVNSRLDSIQAAVLDVKLKYLDEYIRARQKVANAYNTAFSKCGSLIVPGKNPQSTHAYHQYTLKLNGVDRNALQAHLKKKGVPSMVYYPVPLHMQKAYRSERYHEGAFPVAERLSASVLSLPMHTELTEEQTQYIINSVVEFL